MYYENNTGSPSNNFSLSTNASSSMGIQQPLLHRLQMGQQYCTYEEWEAACWFMWKMHSMVPVPNGPVPYLEWMRHQSNYFGVCGFEVPIVDYNPQRPWIVNTIMQEFGAILHSVNQWNSVLVGGGQKPQAIELTYKTNEVWTVHLHLFSCREL